jgi:hypothetical protein
MKVKVQKVSNNQTDYRTPLESLDGMPQPPQVGKSLVLTSSTHESGGIMTSIVKEIVEKGDVIEVKTFNSIYVITKVNH